MIMKNILAKLGIAIPTSVAVTEAVNLDTLWNALITIGVSICSVFAVEGVQWLRKWIQSKINKLDKEESKDKE